MGRLDWMCPLLATLGRLAPRMTPVAKSNRLAYEHPLWWKIRADWPRIAPWWPLRADWTRSAPWWPVAT